jgi:hypothetical protein
VRLPQLHLELTHGAFDEGGEQRGPVGAVEPVQGASEAVVAEKAGLSRLEAEVLGDEAGGPPGEPVEGAACKEEVGDEGAEGDGGDGVP